MQDRERIEMRGRRAIGIGVVVMFVSVGLAMLVSAFAQLNRFQVYNPDPVVLAYPLTGLIIVGPVLFGFAIVVYGFVQLARSRPPRTHA
jgi:hypothetical protein